MTGTVTLLLHGDGTDGSTTFTDSSPTPNTFTANGGASISTAQSKYGGASMYFDGTGDYVTAPYIAGYALGTGDLTLEMWVYRTAATALSILVDFRGPGGGVISAPTLYVTADNNLHLYMSGSDVWVGTTPITLNAWTHVALSRAAGILRVFVNGAVAGATPASANDWVCGGNGIIIGAEGPSLGANTFTGYIDDLRVIKGGGMYDAAFTPPSSALPSSAIIIPPDVLTCPMPTLVAGRVYLIEHGNIEVSTAQFTALGYGGGTSELTGPSFTALGYSPGSAQLSGPAPTLSASGHDSTGENAFAHTLAAPTLSAYGGANATTAMPTPVLSLTATFTVFSGAALSAPTPTLEATGTVSGTGRAGLTVYNPFALTGYSGAVCSVTLTGSPTVQASGTSGAIGTVALTLPLFRLSASGTAQSHGGANLLSPSAQLGATAQAWLMAPGAVLTAIGSAVIVATYEAYAVNLNHKATPGVQPIDETTRYTNYPFTQVVRYQNSYYGVAADGLYLLEGTVDVAAPISYAVKTAVTDFKSSQHKTVASAYLGGRLGPAETLTLYAGEGKETVAYPYTTPRGALAQSHRQPFGKGIKSRYYALGVSGSGELALDSLELEIHQSKRKI